jgi:type II restriction/modification system DNA methylase subunit YeeA
MAWNDRSWILDGAAVRIAMIGFDDGSETSKELNGISVGRITSDLRTDIDLTIAKHLPENKGIAFIGDSKKGSFDIPSNLAQQFINRKGNPNNRPNSDVVIPWANGIDVTNRIQDQWIIDFGPSMAEEDAMLYELPYSYIKEHVLPERLKVRNDKERLSWWLHARSAPDMRKLIKTVSRYIATSNVSKFRTFVWFPNTILPSHSLTVFARDDDYFFGILHSRPHVIWSLRMGTSLEDRPRYTPSNCFETFPFPWAPGREPTNDPIVQAIAKAASELVSKRDNWLNPDGVSADELKKYTLTNLYNQRPPWLDSAHKKLDKAVFAAYGWADNLTDEEILEKLLKLNQDRSKP